MYLALHSSSEVKEYSTTASWRTARLSMMELFGIIYENGHDLSPIFKVAWICMDVFEIDWLHAVDQGVGADFLGNLFIHLRTKLPRNSVKREPSHYGQ